MKYLGTIPDASSLLDNINAAHGPTKNDRLIQGELLHRETTLQGHAQTTARRAGELTRSTEEQGPNRLACRTVGEVGVPTA